MPSRLIPTGWTRQTEEDVNSAVRVDYETESFSIHTHRSNEVKRRGRSLTSNPAPPRPAYVRLVLLSQGLRRRSSGRKSPRTFLCVRSPRKKKRKEHRMTDVSARHRVDAPFSDIATPSKDLAERFIHKRVYTEELSKGHVLIVCSFLIHSCFTGNW